MKNIEKLILYIKNEYKKVPRPKRGTRVVKKKPKAFLTRGVVPTRSLKEIEKDIQRSILDKSILIGINKITRILERQVSILSKVKQISKKSESADHIQIQAIVYANDVRPIWLTEHLSPLSEALKIPLIAYPSLTPSFILSQAVDVKHCCCIAITKQFIDCHPSAQEYIKGISE
ncbi:hypothetical protein ADUPG1_009436 [Aduncisulcus paluster]|uniref:Ribosomal protein L7Ae/L30e/S12e/Gadd45 domain-containing protein n=1 Tax=Aduncisulcus paluster TaxID=2918883 RepID=A0ABQ5KYF2_9EUKA|nr:hypothetical protein ADUPG1_009436 [Aduncisulcus paluster]